MKSYKKETKFYKEIEKLDDERKGLLKKKVKLN